MVVIEWESRRFAAEAASVSQARRFVGDVLGRAALDDLVDVAVLLTSELVTNGVLHAGTTIECRCLAQPGGVRVEVHDASEAAAIPRDLDADAGTGRGLALIESLATDWGSEPTATGKQVWFELGEVALPPLQPDPAGHDPHMVTVTLVGAPVELVLASIQYGDALLREMALLAVERVGRAREVGTRPMIDLGTVVNAASSARAIGRSEADLEIEVPADSGDALMHRLARTEEANHMAEEGLLLSAPAVPEIAMCRLWTFGELINQVFGQAPTPWALDPTWTPTTQPMRLTPAQAAALDRTRLGVIVADDTNHIIHINPSAEALLGWPHGALTGERLLTIIPPSHRADHLAGFTRYAMTGEGPLIGREVEVPALRYDGTLVPIRLHIEVLEGMDGRVGFQATISPA